MAQATGARREEKARVGCRAGPKGVSGARLVSPPPRAFELEVLAARGARGREARVQEWAEHATELLRLRIFQITGN